MPSTYIEILANQSPFPIGQDPRQRVQFSCNYRVRVIAPTDKLEEEIAQILIDAAICDSIGITGDADMIVGPDLSTPEGDGPFVRILATGGTAPESIHGQAAAHIERPTFQIVVTAKKYRTARTRALAIWRELHGTRNTQVTAA